MGRTFAFFWTQRSCSYKLVAVLRAVNEVVATVFPAAEQGDVLHRELIAGERDKGRVNARKYEEATTAGTRLDWERVDRLRQGRVHARARPRHRPRTPIGKLVIPMDVPAVGGPENGQGRPGNATERVPRGSMRRVPKRRSTT